MGRAVIASGPVAGVIRSDSNIKTEDGALEHGIVSGLLSFDNVEVLSSERLLLVDGRHVAMGARAFDVLVALIEHRDRVVSKGELFDTVWAGLVVEDHNLATQVSALRRLLGPHVIATVPNRGYRFVAIASDAARESVARMAAVGCTPSGIGRSVTNLPASLAPLYGQEDDLHALSSCIAAHHLVTVVGTSGMGKTRLAQAAAHAMTQRFPDGVWFVELASLLNASMVPGAVAHALGVALPGQGAPSSELAAAIEAKRNEGGPYG